MTFGNYWTFWVLLSKNRCYCFKSRFFSQALQSEVFSAWHIHGRFAAHELHHDTLEEIWRTSQFCELVFRFLLFSRSDWPMPTRIFSNWSTIVLISRREMEGISDGHRLAGGLVEEWKTWCDCPVMTRNVMFFCWPVEAIWRNLAARRILQIVVKASSFLHRVSC